MLGTIEKLVKLNLTNTKLENVKYYTVATTRPDLITKTNKLLNKVNTFSPLEESHKSEWKFQDFDYSLSSLGFRGQELPSHIDIAAFGCSYTFGQGLPEDKLWHKIISNGNSYNFGQPGASIKSISDIFLVISKHVNIDKAVFLLPNYVRQLVAAKSYDSRTMNLVPLLHNYKGNFQSEYDIQHDMYYKFTPDLELIRRMKDDLYMIDFISKSRNIKTYISSWDRPTYKLIKLMEFTHINLLPEWTSPEDIEARSDLARDRLHPGMSHHKYWADQIEGIVCK